MKHIFTCLFIFSSPCIATGYDKADIFDRNIPITWLGLDCTQMTIIGSAYQMQQSGKLEDVDIRDKYIPAWNELINVERSKYRIAEAMQRSHISYATEVTYKVNAGITRSFFSDTARPLDIEQIAKLTSSYDFKGHTGIGLLFFVETLDKGAGYASMWVTFVDMDTKQVLLIKRMKGEIGGFGFRNYWARAFYLVIEDIEKHWRKWAHERD